MEPYVLVRVAYELVVVGGVSRCFIDDCVVNVVENESRRDCEERGAT